MIVLEEITPFGDRASVTEGVAILPCKAVDGGDDVVGILARFNTGI